MKIRFEFLTLVSAIALTLNPSFAAAQDAKPGVTIYATGGTIAGAAKSSTDTTTYKAGSIGVQALIDAVPELTQVATISGEQVANVPSNDITTTLLVKLSQTINRQLAQPGTHGVVVTHGTDTLEETAFFLDLTTSGSGKPVVIVGAMRPATAVSADGPFNLLQAVSLAASKSAENRGAMVVLNDRIGSAFYNTKTNTTAVDTFRSVEQGYLGMFIGTEPNFYYSPALPTGKLAFDLTGVQSLPKVSIVYMHEDQDNEQLDAAIRAGAKGVVIVGNGNGSVPTVVKARIDELTRQGYPVVRASRTGSGFSTKKIEGIGAGTLNAQKARILLMLGLSKGADISVLRTYFNG
jgi:L-asparaginase